MAATNESQNTEMYSQTLLENDTVLMVYADPEEAYEDSRAFIDDLLGDHSDVDIDLLDETTETEEIVEIKINFDTVVDGESDTNYTYDVGVDETVSPYSSLEKQALRDRFGNGELPDGMELIDRVNENTVHIHNVRKPIRQVVNELIPYETFAGYGFNEDTGYTIGIADFEREIPDQSIDAGPDETIKQICRINVGSSSEVKPTEMLLHKEDRSQHKSTTDERRWGFPVTVHLEATSSEEINNLAQGVIPKLRMQLAAIDGVECVRLQKCEKSVDKEGSCHQI